MSEHHELLHRQEVFVVAGAAMEVLNVLGHGLTEKPYENALIVELRLREVLCRQQPRYVVHYKGTPVGEYIPDLIVFDRIVVDTKVLERIGDHEMGQMMNYLKITGFRVGIILNFKHARLEWKRVVL